MFISLEGIDGAGKSGHVEWIADLFRQSGRTVISTREPGGTPLGEKLRSLLLNEPMDVETELLLMFAARRQHLVETIEPRLAEGQVVISDRFHDSTYAFQGGGRGVMIERIISLDDWTGGARPDLTLYFDLPVQVALNRISSSRDLDRFESERIDFHHKVRTAYLDRAKNNKNRFHIIDSNQPYENVQLSLLSTLRPFINKP